MFRLSSLDLEIMAVSASTAAGTGDSARRWKVGFIRGMIEALFNTISSMPTFQIEAWHSRWPKVAGAAADLC